MIWLYSWRQMFSHSSSFSLCVLYVSFIYKRWQRTWHLSRKSCLTRVAATESIKWQHSFLPVAVFSSTSFCFIQNMTWAHIHSSATIVTWLRRSISAEPKLGPNQNKIHLYCEDQYLTLNKEIAALMNITLELHTIWSFLTRFDIQCQFKSAGPDCQVFSDDAAHNTWNLTWNIAPTTWAFSIWQLPAVRCSPELGHVEWR